MTMTSDVNRMRQTAQLLKTISQRLTPDRLAAAAKRHWYGSVISRKRVSCRRSWSAPRTPR